MASPQLQQTLDMFKEMGAKMAEAKDINAMRAIMIEAQAPAGVTCTPVEAGGVSAEWSVADGADQDKVILYVHGGGYVMGSAGSHRDMTSRLSQAAGARVLSLNYRLAPEHPFPAPVDDTVAAYRWLLGQGIQASNMAIAGDSAGGGLALAALIAIRDAGEPVPAAGIGISPWVDMEGTGESMTTRAAVDPVVQKEGLLGMAKIYLGGADPKNPLAAPLHANLAGLPPLLIQVGDSETLLDDATRITERAQKADVDVTLKIWDEMPHVWHLFAPILPEGRQAIEEIGTFFKEQTA
ncbi:MAG: alpha/beta hydrolase [Desulfurellaceae bacterium]|nr:alpha/beta hydrolase [Desulfurellaceae bacterium]